MLGNILWSLIIFPEVNTALGEPNIYTDLRPYHFFFGVLWEVVYIVVLIAGLIHFSSARFPVWVTKAVIIATACDAVLWLSLMDAFTLEHATGALVGFAVVSKSVTIPLFVIAAVVESRLRQRHTKESAS